MKGNGLYVLPQGFRQKRATSAPRAKPRHIEQDFQKTVAVFLGHALAPPAYWSAIGHGGFSLGRTREEAQRRGRHMKEAGLKAGVPDIMILHDGRAYFLELKSAKGVLSENQREAHERINGAGCRVVVCRDLDAVEAALRGWRLPMQGSVAPHVRAAVALL